METAHHHTGRSVRSRWAPAFREQSNGPDLRMALRHPDWSLALGDVFRYRQGLVGPYLQGRGVDAGWNAGRFAASLLLARPRSDPGRYDGGRLARAEAGWLGAAGAIGLVFTEHEAAPAPDGTAGAVRSVGLAYRRDDRGPHRISAEAGFMRVRGPTGAVEAGPALDASYAFRGRSASITTRLRRVPAATARVAADGNEAYLGGVLRLAGNFGVAGWVLDSSTPIVGERVRPRNTAAAAGLRFNAPRLRAELMARYRESAGFLFQQGEVQRRTVQLGWGADVGPLLFEGSGEIGTVRAHGLDRTTRQLRTALHWFGPDGWAWAGASYAREGHAPASLRFDLVGALRFPNGQIEGGAGAPFRDGAFHTPFTFWSGLALDLSSTSTLVLGTELRPARSAGRQRFRASIGVRQKFALPLPIRRPSAAHGAVYDDRNGNRRRDPGEPGIRGVRVRFGHLRTTTDRAGAFTLPGRPAPGASLSLDAASLPPGFMIPPDVAVPVAGRAVIPLVHAASLSVTLFVDRDDDGARSAAEPTLPGVAVILEDARGCRRAAAADDDGVATFAALPPGSFSLVVVPGPGIRLADPTHALHLRLEPGEKRRIDVAIPTDRREIRMQGDSGSAPAGSAGPGQRIRS